MSSPEGECPDPRCRFGVTEHVYYDPDGEPDRERNLCDWPGHGIIVHARLERIVQRGRWRPKQVTWNTTIDITPEQHQRLLAMLSAPSRPIYMSYSHEPEN